MITLPQEIKLIQPLIQPGERLYLVGGAVRDGILSKPSQDLDFVCSGNPRTIARNLAERLGGAFFMLDDERNACRVLSKDSLGGRLVFDFTQMRGQTLNDDLFERDFTINAMAVDVENPIEIIDPLKGAIDLSEKWLRVCKPTSFSDDPLRTIRAIRYSINYGLQIEPPTLELLQRSINKLPQVSRERKRDELFKILEGRQPWSALDLFVQFNFLDHLGLAGLTEVPQTLLRLRIHHLLVSCLLDEKVDLKLQEGFYEKFRLIFAACSPWLKQHYEQVNLSDRSNLALNNLISLLWDENEIEAARDFEKLALSREEQEQICIALRYKCCIQDQFSAQKLPDRKFIYRYFQALGVAGLDVAVLTLADAAASYGNDSDMEKWSELAVFCEKLVETWFNNPEFVNPKLLLNGRDLMFEFDILPGPRIGQLLEGLREEQAVGAIQNRTQALAWVDAQIQKRFIEG